MMETLNPKIVALLQESDKSLVGTSVNSKNCQQVLQTLALQHLAGKLSDDRAKKAKRRTNQPRLLPA